MESSDEEIVISGISGKFPDCDNMKELSEKLFANTDLLTDEDRRFPLNYYNLPKLGLLKDLTKFDASFFKISPTQAKLMDPQMRILLELVFEAIIDSGNNPDFLRGTNTGVFIGQTGSEITSSHRKFLHSYKMPFLFTGVIHSYLANRISYSYDFKGPTFTVDSACSSSLTAFDQALRAIKNGSCDRAIVGGTMLVWDAIQTSLFDALQVHSRTGSCKAFDNNADGFVCAETVCVILLERKSLSKRIYTTVVASGSNSNGYSNLGIMHPSGDMQQQLFENICKEADISLKDIEYIEAHGTGTVAGDVQELNGVPTFVSEKKGTQTLVGSVKSNMGHSQGASGMCSIAKVLVTMENGLIPANLHYKNPNVNVPALLNGRIKVVNENTPYNNGLVVVSNFGIGGTNTHLILKPNDITKRVEESVLIPRIITVSGRTESSVKSFLKSVEETGDSSLFGMVNDIHSSNITGHSYRGYSVLSSGEELMEVSKYTEEKRQVWFIFAGMGSQWRGMGKDLLKINIFKESIAKCSAVLEPYDINILHNIENEIETHELTLLLIGSIQIAMVDVLKSVGIHPDGIIGHSMGEIPAAYADDALTLEEAMLCVYYKVRTFLESGLPLGIMASVGLSWSDVKAHCPPGIYPACDNSKHNVTISGPTNEMRQFIKALQSRGVFAREVKSFMEAAFHSPYVEKGYSMLLNYLNKVLPNPKKYSSRWVCTSVPRDEWDNEYAKTCSAEYCANNLKSPVYFRDAVKQIPDNSVVIEVGPHCIFQTILSHSLPTCINIGLAKRDHPSGVKFLLSSIGKMYISGLQPNVQVLYPKMSYPVPRGTPMISPMIEWDHSTSWKITTFTESHRNQHKAFVHVNMSNDKYKYVKGHVVDGLVLFPATGYMHMVWEVLSDITYKDMDEHPVVFEDIQLHRATFMQEKEDIIFKVDIFAHSGEFEILESNSLVASGKIHYVNDLKQTILKPNVTKTSDHILLTENDVYKELRLRGLEYQDFFKGIFTVDYQAQTGELKWNGNWVSFTDTMLQFHVVGSLTSRATCVPIGFKKIVVDPSKLKSFTVGDKVPVCYDKDLQIIQSAGIEIHKLRMNIISRKILHPPPLLERYCFVPYDNKESFAASSYNNTLSVVLQIFLENIGTSKLNLVEVSRAKQAEELIAHKIATVLKQEPLYQASITVLVENAEDFTNDESLVSVGVKFANQNSQNKLKKEEIHLLLGSQILSDAQNMESFFHYGEILKPGAFILLQEISHANITGMLHGWAVVSCQCYGDTQFILLRKPTDLAAHIVVNISQQNFHWMENLKTALRKSKETNELVYVVNEGDEMSGIVGMVNCLRKEPGGDKVRCVCIQDKTAPKFSASNSFYEDILKKDLCMNVYSNKCWGTYRHIALEGTNTKKVEHAYMNTLNPGNINSLTWIESPNYCYDNLCYVYYAALNFKDVLFASGLFPRTMDMATKDCFIGIEFSGCDSNGKKIMGIVETCGIATTVSSNCVIEVPDKWTLEEAATVPVVYATVYNALIVRGQLKKGQTALIHAGAGGVGIAAITVALKMGVTVFTTVGSQEKREFLKKRFPQLTDFHIANSRDESFKNHVIKATNGRGVDLVLNSLTGEKAMASIECVAKFGKFIEIGKLDLVKNTNLGMSVFLNSIAYHAVALDQLLKFNESGEEVLMTLQLLQDGIKSGVVEPLPATVFSEDEITDAFKFLGASKHTGKVLIKIRDDEGGKCIGPIRKEVQAVPRTHFNANKVYIIAGGLGGFGLELTNWLISRNAKNIVLTSRTGVQNDYQAAFLATWKSMNINVIVLTADCTEEKGVVNVITEACKHGAIGGIFNLAVVLRDDLFENLTENDFITCCKPKINITRHFDKVSRLLCPDLDYFVVFSSAACGKGNQAQTNYGLANSTIERICEKRKSDLLPGLAIQWGMIGDVGILAEMMAGRSMEIDGYYPQSISSCLSTLDIFFSQPHPVLSSMVVAEKNVSSGTSTDSMLSAIAEVLGISNINDINPSSTLSQLGADSIILTAFIRTLESKFDLVLTPEEIRDLTIEKLKILTSKQGSGGVSDLSSDKSLLKKDKNVPEVWMPTVIPKNSLVYLSSSEKSNNVNIFMIHPLQGTVGMLEPLASALSANVWGLQCTPDAPCDSIQSLAAFYIEKIKTVQKTGPYLICGYSMGGVVGFEIGVQLEESGEVVSLIILDTLAFGYDPVFMKKFTGIWIVKDEKVEDDYTILVVFMVLCGYTDVGKITSLLDSLETLENCISGVTETIHRDTNCPPDQIRIAIDLMIKKQKAVNNYKPRRRFTGNVALVKSIQIKGSSAEDNIRKSCVKQLEVKSLEDSHDGIIQNEESLNKIKDLIVKYMKLCGTNNK